MLSDYNKLSPEDNRIQEVTRLGLTYNLLTDCTSFVAIDTQVRAKGGELTTVKQLLPLPKEVSNKAVGKTKSYAGAGGGGIPEPGTLSLLGFGRVGLAGMYKNLRRETKNKEGQEKEVRDDDIIKSNSGSDRRDTDWQMVSG